MTGVLSEEELGGKHLYVHELRRGCALQCAHCASLLYRILCERHYGMAVRLLAGSTLAPAVGMPRG